MSRNDEQVQQAARNLFEGVAPERAEELKRLWAEHTPRFNLFDDLGPEGRIVMDAGLYREVRFNHRALQVFWLASFAAWEGYKAVQQGGVNDALDLTRFAATVDVTLRAARDDASLSTALPFGIPEPGTLPDRETEPGLRAAAELAHFAAGFVLLHEISHIINQQRGTGASIDAPAADNHREELACDAFAIRFLLEKVGRHVEHEDASDRIRLKRKIGIYFALFAMTLLTKDRWSKSKTHPAMQTRIDEAIGVMQADGSDIADAIAHTAFVALHKLWPGAPVAFGRPKSPAPAPPDV